MLSYFDLYSLFKHSRFNDGVKCSSDNLNLNSFSKYFMSKTYSHDMFNTNVEVPILFYNGYFNPKQEHIIFPLCTDYFISVYKEHKSASAMLNTHKARCNNLNSVYTLELDEGKYHCGCGFILDFNLNPLVITSMNVIAKPVEGLNIDTNSIKTYFDITDLNLYLNECVFIEDTKLNKFLRTTLLKKLYNLKVRFADYLNYALKIKSIGDYYITMSKGKDIGINVKIGTEINKFIHKTKAPNKLEISKDINKFLLTNFDKIQDV